MFELYCMFVRLCLALKYAHTGYINVNTALDPTIKMPLVTWNNYETTTLCFVMPDNDTKIIFSHS